MRLDDFDFGLPEDRIALRPASPRDAARLLVVRPDRLEDWIVSDLPELLRPGDVLVVNDTKVIPAQLSGDRLRAGAPARIDVTLIERSGPETYDALARPGRKLAEGDAIHFGAGNEACQIGELSARVERKFEEGRVRLVFDRSGAALDEAIALTGVMPLPPYIARRRAADERDFSDYQTVYAAREGAVAAPTAGLHMTERLLDELAGRGIGRESVTLHVGAGTFLPVKTQDIAGHRMHAEHGSVDEAVAERLNAARRGGGRLVAVGTTSLRLLETAADPDGMIRGFDGATDIFITPGYRFRAVDLLLTNFHLPRSTLVMLVAAFSGLERMKAAYAHAVSSGYRFYSYGDACLLYPAAQAGGR